MRSSIAFRANEPICQLGGYSRCRRLTCRYLATALTIMISMRIVAADDAVMPDHLDLIGYTRLALKKSDQAQDLKDTLFSRHLDVSLADYKFKTQLVPLANIGVSTSAGTQSVGLEARRANEYGTGITIGLVGEKVISNNYSVTNSHSAMAFVRVSQGLLRRWGSEYNRMDLTSAELEQRKAQLTAVSTRQDIILAAVQAYYQAVLSKQLISRTEQALSRSREHLEAARDRQSVGLVSMSDVYRAKLAMLDMESKVKDQQHQYVNSIDELYEKLAMKRQESLSLDEEITRITPLITQDWEQQLYASRPDWRAHLIDMRLAGLSRAHAEQDLLPDLSLNLSLEQQGLGNSFDDAKNLDETNWAVQLQLTSTLDRFKEKATLSRERLKARRLIREGQALKRRIRREVDQAFDDLVSEQQRYRISQERHIQSQKALELAKIRYKRGLSSNLEVLDSEIAYSNSELDILRTLVDYNIAAVRLGHALGVLDLDWLEVSMQPPGEPSSSTGNNPG